VVRDTADGLVGFLHPRAAALMTCGELSSGQRLRQNGGSSINRENFQRVVGSHGQFWQAIGLSR